MNEHDEKIKDQEYDVAATATSKATIFVFISTFTYMLFTTNIPPSFIGGIIFFIIGMYVVSLAIAMPLMMIRVKFPKLSLIISVVDMAITIFVTKWVYLYLFNN